MKHLAVVVSAAFAAFSAISDVRRAATAPAIDGDLADAVWSKAEWETGFRKFEREKRRDVKADTEFAVLADDENLYIAVRCLEPDMARFKDAADKEPSYVGQEDRLNDIHGSILSVANALRSVIFNYGKFTQED